MRGPLARYRLYGQTADYFTLVRRLLERGGGAEDPLASLEQSAAAFFGTRHAIAVPQNRVGIYCLIKAMVRPGRRVVMSPYTLTDVVNMVITAGGEPVFADVERQSCNIDPVEIEALIDDCTDAVIVTHLHGLICDMDRIARICRERGVKLIEDAAQASGARQGARYAGTLGDAGVLSFGMYKNINSFYGGMVLTDDDLAAARVREILAGFPLTSAWTLFAKAAKAAMTDLATHPFLFRTVVYWIFRYAYLNRIEALNRTVKIELDPKLKEVFPEHFGRRLRPAQARIVSRQLDALDQQVAKRIETARRYDEGFRATNAILRPPLREDASHSYLHYPIQVEDRDALIRHAVRNGRDLAIQHLRNCAELPCFARWHRDCPNAREAAASVVLLPTYPGYQATEIDATVSAIRDHFRA